MTQVNCAQCGNPAVPSKAYVIDGKILCEPCANTVVKNAKAAKQPIKVLRYVDRTVCARCNTYIGEPPASLDPAKPHLCQACETLVQDWPYPKWLKLSFAALLILLLIALVTGRRYFDAGKNLYRGEEMVEQHKYADALPYLEQTLKIAPKSDKAVLLTAKAALLSGNVELAGQAIDGHSHGHFDDKNDPDFREVESLWNRANDAIEDLQKAGKLSEQSGNEKEVARLVHEAATNYPQLPNIGLSVDYADAGVAFVNKDYDTFLRIAQKDWDRQQDPSSAAALSSAFACKYAVTGDAAFRQQSEKMLAAAKDLSQGNPAALAAYTEYAERIEYRLKSRQIIDKPEFDRRFRSGKQAAQ